jgi:hypothetical protein
MKTELDLIAEDYRKAAEAHARAGNFDSALGYLELWQAAAGEEEGQE